MNKDYYSDNLDFLYNKSNEIANLFYRQLLDTIDLYKNTYCINDNQVNEYYIQQFEEVKKVLKTEFKSNLNLKYLFNFSFSSENVIINKTSFSDFAIKYLDLHRYTYLEGVLDNIFKKSLKQNRPIEEQLNEVNNFFNKIKFSNAELVIKLSLHLEYFKHLLSEHKQNDIDNLKVKGLPKFDLYQRYLILSEKTNIITDILKQETSVNGKHKLLAILLNCSIDNAKHLLNNSYSKKLQNVTNKQDEVNLFIDNLK